MEQFINIAYRDLQLAATIHTPAPPSRTDSETEPAAKFPLIIICHGFVGSRVGVDRLFVKAAREFSARGFMVLRFDYSGCGESEGDYGAGGLDSLVEQTLHVISYALTIADVDPERIILLGHSLGGAVALLTATEDTRIKKLVMWSAVAHPFKDIVNIVGKKGYEEAMQYGRVDYLGYSLQDCFFESLSRHHPLKQAKKYHGDVLVVHGNQDDVIPVDYSFLYQVILRYRLNGYVDKEVIQQADHTYSSAAAFDELVSKTVHWIFAAEQRMNAWSDWMI